MAQLTLTIIRADTNAAFDVDLPDDAPVPDLLTEVIREMGLPRSDESGEYITYELSSKRTGDLVMDGTLASRGVKSGDVLLLTSTFVAGFDLDDATSLVGIVVLFLVGLLGLAFLATLPMYFIWNWVLIDAAPSAHLAHIGLGQAFGLSILIGMLRPSSSDKKSS